MLAMCLPACSWAQIVRTPFNYTITARTLLVKCDGYQFQRLILQFPASGKKLSYRKHVHHAWYVEQRESGSMFCMWDNSFPEVRTNRVESTKHSTENWKVPWLNNEIHLSRSSAKSILPVSLFTPPICGL